jgi:glycosyltransferase involved in cell wall biosynthesis
MNLKNINVVESVNRGDGYDVCFWVSDGSVPTLKSRRNILHFQVPFHNVNGKSLMNKMKFFRINNIICNSLFTKKIIDSEYGVNSTVVYPPVDTSSIKPKRKENIILFVGRFSALLQSKNQDVLVDSFKKMVDEGLNGWKLIIAGGVEVGAEKYLENIVEMAKGYPIEIVQSPSFSVLKELYGKAKIFWSASGMNVDENKNPEKVEHFGMTVVEAMAGGAVPLIFNAGGHKEIITDKESGFLWNNQSELIKISKLLITNSVLLRKYAKLAVSDSSKFSYEKFASAINKTI